MRISDWSSDVCSSDLPVEHAAFGFVALAAIGRRRWPEAVEHAPPPRPLARGRLLAAADLFRILALLGRRSTLCRWHFALGPLGGREEHTSELQSLMRISYAVFGWKKKQKSSTKNIL